MPCLLNTTTNCLPLAPQNGTTTIKRCKGIADMLGALRTDGCYEGLELEAEPAIFRAQTTTVPTGASLCASTSEWVVYMLPSAAHTCHLLS